MNPESIYITEKGATATIFIPEFNNSLLNKKAISEFTDLMHYLEDHSLCKNIVIRCGPGREKLPDGDDVYASAGAAKLELLRIWENMIRLLEKIEKVTMAVIEGECIGAGAQLALACDIRVATDDALFSHDEVKRGILPGATIFQLGKFCGLGRMLELVQTGRVYTAAEARSLGVVSNCCGASIRDEEIDEILLHYRVSNPNMHKLIRRLAKESFEMSYEEFIGCFMAAQHRVIAESASIGGQDGA